jgi:hypothetical protein
MKRVYKNEPTESDALAKQFAVLFQVQLYLKRSAVRVQLDKALYRLFQ